MVQQKAKDLPIGQLVKLNSGVEHPVRYAEVTGHKKTDFGHVAWVKVVDGPEEDLIGAVTTIEGSETFQGIGWMCVSSLPS